MSNRRPNVDSNRALEHRDAHSVLSRQEGDAFAPKDMDWLDVNIPCQAACPAGTRIPDYLGEIHRGNYAHAYLINLVDNVFPAVLGRVCSRPCEAVCRHGRDGLGEPVAICLSKRAAADLGDADPVALKPIYPSTGKRVAIIGAGPAGLTVARELSLLGHAATVFEKQSEPGGLMKQGIPAFRLPRNIVDKEIEQIRCLGVEIRCNQPVGLDIPLAELLAGHDAVVVAAGTLQPRAPDLPGKTLNGIQHGLDFLRAVNSGRRPEIGKRVVVIGGGFTAVDCARSAVRLGAAARVHYRRTRAEMRVIEGEIGELEREGIGLDLLVSPTAYLGARTGSVKAVRFVRNTLGARDGQRDPRLLAVLGSEFDIGADTVLLATGQVQDTSWLDASIAGRVLDENGRMRDGAPLSTDQPGLFLAGDFSIGASTLIDAIGHGKRCARALDEYLMGEKRLMEVAQIETRYETGRTPSMDAIDRQSVPTLPVGERNLDSEVEMGYTSTLAGTEAMRCYLCHFKFEIDNEACIYCDKCLEVKPHEHCIVPVDGLSHDEEGRITGYTPAADPTPGRYALLYIDQDQCTRCGRCEKVCPVDCISIQKVTRETKRACDVQGAR